MDIVIIDGGFFKRPKAIGFYLIRDIDWNLNISRVNTSNV
jgi:hypothetical protein